jgi:ribosomal protein S20
MDWKSTAQTVGIVAAPLVVVGAAVAVAHVGGVRANPRLSSAQDSERQAHAALAEGRHEDASRLYAQAADEFAANGSAARAAVLYRKAAAIANVLENKSLAEDLRTKMKAYSAQSTLRDRDRADRSVANLAAKAQSAVRRGES